MQPAPLQSTAGKDKASQDYGLKTVKTEEKEFQDKRDSHTGRQGQSTALEEGLKS